MDIKGSVIVRGTADIKLKAQEGFTTQTIASGNVILTSKCTKWLLYTALTDFNLTLPDASTLTAGWQICVISAAASTGDITIKDAAATTLYTVKAGKNISIVLTDSSNAAGVWSTVADGAFTGKTGTGGMRNVMIAGTTPLSAAGGIVTLNPLLCTIADGFFADGTPQDNLLVVTTPTVLEKPESFPATRYVYLDPSGTVIQSLFEQDGGVTYPDIAVDGEIFYNKQTCRNNIYTEGINTWGEYPCVAIGKVVWTDADTASVTNYTYNDWWWDRVEFPDQTTKDTQVLSTNGGALGWADIIITLLAVTDIEPATCVEGDLYYNTTTNLVYEAIAANIWSAEGTAPVRNRIYREQENNFIYVTAEDVLVQVGGGGSGEAVFVQRSGTLATEGTDLTLSPYILPNIERVLSVNVNNVTLLPINYTLNVAGTSIILDNAIAAGSNYCVTFFIDTTDISALVLNLTPGKVPYVDIDNVLANSSIMISNSNVGIGTTTPSVQLTQKSDASQEMPTMSSELLVATDTWTSTNWAGDFTVGFTHTPGYTDALICETFTPTLNAGYLIFVTESAYTTGSYSIALGGASATRSSSSNLYWGIRCTTPANKLTIVPSSDFDGTLSFSIKRIITAYPPVYRIENTLGDEDIHPIEIRSSKMGNLFIGYSAGRYNTYGLMNAAIGANALAFNITGSDNTCIGSFAMFNASAASQNTAVGNEALCEHRYGDLNTAVGYQAGKTVSGGTNAQTGTNNVLLGANTQLSSDAEENEIVIGADAVGNGSNTATLGNASTMDTYLKGAVHAASVSCSPTISSGTIAPSSTPSKIGDLYIDTVAVKIYIAAGTSSSSDWVLVN